MGSKTVRVSACNTKSASSKDILFDRLKVLALKYGAIFCESFVTWNRFDGRFKFNTFKNAPQFSRHIRAWESLDEVKMGE